MAIPKEAASYYDKGFACQRAGEFFKAIDAYTQAIEIYPHYAEAYNNRGLAYRAQGDLEKAFSDYSMAIKLDPHLAEAFVNRGILYGEKQDLLKALRDFNQALASVPHHANAYYNRGIAYNELGNYQKAAADLRRAKFLGAQIDKDLIAELVEKTGKTDFFENRPSWGWVEFNALVKWVFYGLGYAFLFLALALFWLPILKPSLPISDFLVPLFFILFFVQRIVSEKFLYTLSLTEKHFYYAGLYTMTISISWDLLKEGSFGQKEFAAFLLILLILFGIQGGYFIKKALKRERWKIILITLAGSFYCLFMLLAGLE